MFWKMERSDILGGNERKTNFEQKAKHCPFAYGAKTGGLRKRASMLMRENVVYGNQSYTSL